MAYYAIAAENLDGMNAGQTEETIPEALELAAIYLKEYRMVKIWRVEGEIRRMK